MKKILKIVLVSALAVSLAAMVVGCKSQKPDTSEPPELTSSDVTEATADSPITEDEASKSSDAVPVELEVDVDLQEIGVAGVGFVSLPGEWEPLEAADTSSSARQWVNEETGATVTFDVMPAASEPQAIEVVSAEIVTAFELSNASNISSVEVDGFGDVPMLKLSCTLSDGTAKSVWLYADENGDVCTITAEGEIDAYSGIVTAIAETLTIN